jgi:hypothetical protein
VTRFLGFCPFLLFPFLLLGRLEATVYAGSSLYMWRD